MNGQTLRTAGGASQPSVVPNAKTTPKRALYSAEVRPRSLSRRKLVVQRAPATWGALNARLLAAAAHPEGFARGLQLATAASDAAAAGPAPVTDNLLQAAPLATVDDSFIEDICQLSDEGYSSISFNLPNADGDVLPTFATFSSGDLVGCATLKDYARDRAAEAADPAAYGLSAIYSTNLGTTAQLSYVLDCEPAQDCTVTQMVVSTNIKTSDVTFQPALPDANATGGRRLQLAVAEPACDPTAMDVDTYNACVCAQSAFCNPDAGYTDGSWIQVRRQGGRGWEGTWRPRRPRAVLDERDPWRPRAPPADGMLPTRPALVRALERSIAACASTRHSSHVYARTHARTTTPRRARTWTTTLGLPPPSSARGPTTAPAYPSRRAACSSRPRRRTRPPSASRTC